MKQLYLTSLTLAMALSCVNSQAAELIKNDFSDGTVQGWSKGGAASIPLSVKTDTDGNKYLYLKTAKNKDEGADTKVTFDTDPGPWHGDYNAKGVKSISVRFKNLGTTPLEMHVGLSASIADLATRDVVSKGVVIPADKQWHTASYSLADADVQLVDKYGHGGSSMQGLSHKQVKNYISQVRFSNGHIGDATGTGHGTPDGGQIYRGWNDGPDLADGELAIDDITLSSDAADAVAHNH